MPAAPHFTVSLRRALAFVRPYRGGAIAILCFTLAVGGLNAAEPVIYKYLFDGLAAGRRRTLILCIAWLVVAALLREGLTGLSNWLTWRTRLRVHYDMLDVTVGRLHLLPVSFHRAEGVGAVMTKLDRGIQGFVGAITELAFNALPALVYLAVSVVVMVRLDRRLALVVLAFVPLPALITALSAPVQTDRERKLLDWWARIYERFNEVLSGIVTVKSFSMEEKEKQRFLVNVEAANEVVIRGVGFDARVGAGQNLVVSAARITGLGFGGLLVLRGHCSLGTVVAFLSYIGGLFGPVQGLSGTYKTMRVASASIDAVFAILDAQDHLGDAPDAREAGTLRGEIELEGVHFHYESKSGPVLAGIDLHIAPGETVALVGPSGAGKSTLIALLQRFYDPSAGAVRIDGHDLRALKQASLRRNIGVVLQDALLFNESVRDNIAYARPEASLAEIEAVARAAHAHDFIMTLPKGYDTLVGERGGRLSGGERQRIAIARALLKDPPIIVLDEATSALDAESEALVQEALERLTRGRTTLVIAHRLATVVNAHRIVVLRHGRICEIGSHGELMAAGGYYASLVRRQTGGLIDGTGTRAA